MLPILLAFILLQASASERALPLSAAHPQTPVPAEKEVSASSGPVHLTFRLYKTHIKVGESLWYQLRVTNRGKKMFRVIDKVFDNPFEIRSSANYRMGTFLMLTDAKGREVAPKEFQSIHRSLPTEPYVNESDPELKKLEERWKREGLSESAIRERAVEYTKQERSKEARRNAFVVELKPGGSIVTPPWAYDTRTWIYDEPWKNKPAPEPIGEFAELEMFRFTKPGIYRVRAVYDSRHGVHDAAELRRLRKLAKESSALKEVLAEEANRKPEFYEVRAVTRWIEVTVSP